MPGSAEVVGRGGSRASWTDGGVNGRTCKSLGIRMTAAREYFCTLLAFNLHNVTHACGVPYYGSYNIMIELQ